MRLAAAPRCAAQRPWPLVALQGAVRRMFAPCWRATASSPACLREEEEEETGRGLSPEANRGPLLRREGAACILQRDLEVMVDNQEQTPKSLLFSKDYVKPTEAGGRKKWKGEGTTPNLENIVIGRCYEYIRIVNPSVGEKNCTEIWEAFKKAFINKDPCNILPLDYELFINLSLHTIPPNKSLFWENNHLLASSYSDRTRRYMSLCDTLIGSCGDFLNWCGQANDTGFNYDSCPTTEECENNAVESFWRIASITYAKQSSGVIYIMLNGSAIGGAYPVKSFFAVYEVPNFQKDRISRIEIWVMDDIGGPDLDSCGKGSVQILEKRLKTMGYDVICIDNYKSVLLLNCLDYPNHSDCSIVSSAPSTQRGLVTPNRGSSWNRLIYTVSVVFVFELCFNQLN